MKLNILGFARGGLNMNKKYKEFVVYDKDDKEIDWVSPVKKVEKTDAINKLGKLEDIEEELGINLDTFIKVLKSKNLVGRFNKYGQYDKKAIRKLRNIKLDIIRKRFLADDYGWVINIPLNFNKYGKTWALTKEELL